MKILASRLDVDDKLQNENESPILSALFKECKLVDFGGGIHLKNKQEYNDGAKPEFIATLNIDFWYKAKAGGTNSVTLVEAQYIQSEGKWEFFGQD